MAPGHSQCKIVQFLINNTNKLRDIDMSVIPPTNKRGIKYEAAVTWVATVISLIAGMVSILVYFNESYVSKSELAREQELRTLAQAQVNDALSEIRLSIIKSNDRIAYEIKMSKLFSLMNRRDVLQTRTKLTLDEQAELRFLQTKINELSASANNGTLIQDINLDNKLKDKK